MDYFQQMLRVFKEVKDNMKKSRFYEIEDVKDMASILCAVIDIMGCDLTSREKLITVIEDLTHQVIKRDLEDCKSGKDPEHNEPELFARDFIHYIDGGPPLNATFPQEDLPFCGNSCCSLCEDPRCCKEPRG